MFFLGLLELLYQTIPKNMEGIYILSDRAYKDSNTIFYRYGFFKEDLEYLEKGIPTLLGPNGENGKTIKNHILIYQNGFKIFKRIRL